MPRRDPDPTPRPFTRRLGVIGDVHAEEGRLAGALAWMDRQGVDTLICTGDLADGPGSVDRCVEQLAIAGVITVRGNHDRWLLEDRVREIPHAHRLDDIGSDARSYLEDLPKTAALDTPMGSILLCHGIGDNDLRKVWPGTERMEVERSEELDAILADGSHRFVVNGHMHYRVLIDFPELLLINAGTLTARHRPGISLIDFDRQTIEAHEFDGDQVARHVAVHRLGGAGRRVWSDTQAFDGTWTAVALYDYDPA